MKSSFFDQRISLVRAADLDSSDLFSLFRVILTRAFTRIPTASEKTA